MLRKACLWWSSMQELMLTNTAASPMAVARDGVVQRDGTDGPPYATWRSRQQAEKAVR
jgi:hypothetical protein